MSLFFSELQKKSLEVYLGGRLGDLARNSFDLKQQKTKATTTSVSWKIGNFVQGLALISVHGVSLLQGGSLVPGPQFA